MRAWTAVRTYLAARHRFRHLRGEALLRYQDDRARDVVAYAAKHSPFYRDHLAGGGDWRTLPTTDKGAMMAHFADFNTRGITLDDAMRADRIDGVTVGLSSGTSGHRGIFLVDDTERTMWAATILARALPNLSRIRLAFFLRSNSNLYESLGRWIRFRYFSLAAPIEQSVAALNEFQPDVIAAPPSLLEKLAASPALTIRPTRLVSVAEVLEPQDEERLRAAFGVPVHQVYQCTEGLLGVSCERGSLHVQEDLVALQFEPVPGGGGRVTPIVTDLHRRTQPIIRYRLDDLVTLAPEPCACGSAFRVIARIEGRCGDACTLGTQTLFPDDVRRIVLESDPRIDDYQVVQQRPGQLTVRLQVRGNFADVADAVRRRFAAYDCVVEEGLAPIAAGEKRRRVIHTWRESS